ncbi:MAG: glycoside hydrolase family 75 protein [Akkermansiaceae bacterium]
MSNLHNDDLISKRHLSRPSFLARIWWIRAALFLLVCFAIVFPFTKTGKDAVRAWNRPAVKSSAADTERVPEVKPEPKPMPEPVVDPEPMPEPAPVVKRVLTVAIESDADVRKTLKGFGLKYQANFPKGEQASKERVRDDSYVASFSLDVKMPTPATTAKQLAEINPHLIKMLPGLGDLTEKAKVSPFYTKLYNNKAERLKREVLNLGKVLTSHNFYDCETMLEMAHPVSGRKVFLFQADMDVVTDGSDGDRLEVMPDAVVNSTYYQPFTSYSWDKVTKKKNPMVKGWEQRMKNAKAELGRAGTTPERKAWLRSRMKMLQVGIDDMRIHSFLIAEHDPFIVISVDKIKAARSQKDVPGVGDYVAVIYKDKIYPAIVGDGGPTFKAGESSLRLAKEINPIATSYHRPVSTLGVTYVVFPGTAVKPRSAPDYDLWYEQCSKLLGEIGGLGEGYTLHRWEDTFPKPEPDPEPELVPEEEAERELDSETVTTPNL